MPVILLPQPVSKERPLQLFSLAERPGKECHPIGYLSLSTTLWTFSDRLEFVKKVAGLLDRVDGIEKVRMRRMPEREMI
jgi:hypothetical protein